LRIDLVPLYKNTEKHYHFLLLKKTSALLFFFISRERSFLQIYRWISFSETAIKNRPVPDIIIIISITRLSNVFFEEGKKAFSL